MQDLQVLPVIKSLVEQGFVLSVRCAEEGDVLQKRTNKAYMVYEAAQSVDLARIYVYDGDGERVGTVLVEGYEVVDYSESLDHNIS